MKVSIVFISILLMLFFGCQSQETDNQENTQNNKNMVLMDSIKHSMINDVAAERENPFTTREFSSYLNGEWIGNAVSYGCYRKGQAPGVKGPSEEEILEDLNIISEYWNLIRVYGADEDAARVLHVIKKNNLPIKVMLGVWLEDETNNPERKTENIEQVMTAVRLANEYDDILSAINVGNETQVFWSAHKMDTEKLIYYIRMVRNNTDIPVTTADDYNFWNKPESKTVAEEVDFIVVHIYPLWNGQTLENSIDWMNDIFFSEIKKAYPDKTLVLGEIGWATNYDSTKTGDGEQGSLIKGEVSYSAQAEFLSKLSEWIVRNGVTTFLFEAFDEPWKGGGELSSPNEIEKHWGVFYENRTPKESFKNFLIKTDESN